MERGFGRTRNRITPFLSPVAIAFLFFASLHGNDATDLSHLRETIASLDAVILEEPNSASAYQSRGVAYFELGEFQKAIDDFDRVIELYPSQEPHHWQRGICYYYAGEFEKGVKQFELHQTVNRNDVENAVWHFICKARASGIEPAQASLIPIKFDSRVPMTQIWELFSGAGSPESVLQIASPKGEESSAFRQRLCYAHLYIGLYHEAHGRPNLAQKHIALAATKYAMDNYMGMVARVHHRLLSQTE